MTTRWNSKTVHWRDCVSGWIEIDPKSVFVRYENHVKKGSTDRKKAENVDYSCRVEGDSWGGDRPTLVQKFHDDVRKEGRIDLNFTGNLTWFLGVCYSYGEDGSVSCDQQHYIETMAKTWLSEGTEIFWIDETSKDINPCKLPLMYNADLDPDRLRLQFLRHSEIAVSETPGDPVFVAKYQ